MLYPRQETLEASPKAISGRTSYLRVRLAFHPYPQVIRRLFNDGRFGPPREFNRASPCPWVAHPVSGLRSATNAPCSDSLSLRLRIFVLNLATLAQLAGPFYKKYAMIPHSTEPSKDLVDLVLHQMLYLLIRSLQRQLAQSFLRCVGF